VNHYGNVFKQSSTHRQPDPRPGTQADTGRFHGRVFQYCDNFSWTDSSGQKQDGPKYHNIVAWRKLADICGQYLKKGGKVFIEGRIQTRDWKGRTE